MSAAQVGATFPTKERSDEAAPSDARLH